MVLVLSYLQRDNTMKAQDIWSTLEQSVNNVAMTDFSTRIKTLLHAPIPTPSSSDVLAGARVAALVAFASDLLTSGW